MLLLFVHTNVGFEPVFTLKYEILFANQISIYIFQDNIYLLAIKALFCWIYNDEQFSQANSVFAEQIWTAVLKNVH